MFLKVILCSSQLLISHSKFYATPPTLPSSELEVQQRPSSEIEANSQPLSSPGSLYPQPPPPSQDAYPISPVAPVDYQPPVPLYPSPTAPQPLNSQPPALQPVYPHPPVPHSVYPQTPAPQVYQQPSVSLPFSPVTAFSPDMSSIHEAQKNYNSYPPHPEPNPYRYSLQYAPNLYGYRPQFTSYQNPTQSTYEHNQYLHQSHANYFNYPAQYNTNQYSRYSPTTTPTPTGETRNGQANNFYGETSSHYLVQPVRYSPSPSYSGSHAWSPVWSNYRY